MRILRSISRASPAELAVTAAAVQSEFGACEAERRLARAALRRAQAVGDDEAVIAARERLVAADEHAERASGALDALLGQLVIFGEAA